MKRRVIALWYLLFGISSFTSAQELFVFTEPASNMPTNAIGLRINNEGNTKPNNNRTIAEVMFGANRNLMFHLQGFLSNMDGNYRWEGASLYGKFRFLSKDGDKSHLRGALFARVGTSKRPTFTEDINLEGDNSGFQGGLIFTQLIHKLALSTSFGYSKANWKSSRQLIEYLAPDQLLSYSFSSGYLLLPIVYKSYKQPNINVYMELLGKTNPRNGHSFIDLAPSLQLILNSKTRIDLGYRFQATGNIESRYLKNMYLARVEFNFFNALSK